MAITDVNELIDGLANKGQLFESMKSFSPQASGAYVSLFHAAGQPGAPTYPSPGVNGAIPTDATPGAWPFTNPTGGDKSYLSHFDNFPQVAGTLIICDRLYHNSGLSPTTVGAQSISMPSLTRYTDGVGVEIWMDVYGTAMGTGSTAPQVTYTDQDGNTGNTATAVGFASAAAINRCFQFTLAAGDIGVRSIQSFNNMATHTSGAFGIVLRKRLAAVSSPGAGIGGVLDFIDLGGIEIPDDACLEFLWLASATTANVVNFSHGIEQN